MTQTFVNCPALEKAFQQETNLELIFVGLVKSTILDIPVSDYTIFVDIYPYKDAISIVEYRGGAYELGNEQNFDLEKLNHQYRCFSSLKHSYSIQLFISSEYIKSYLSFKREI